MNKAAYMFLEIAGWVVVALIVVSFLPFVMFVLFSASLIGALFSE